MNTSDLSDFSDPGSNDIVLKIINSAPAKSCELDVCVHACVCTCGVHVCVHARRQINVIHV